MEPAKHVDAVRRERRTRSSTRRVRRAVDAAVPSCPDWTIADLLAHVGRIQRWVNGIIVTRPDAADRSLAPARTARRRRPLRLVRGGCRLARRPRSVTRRRTNEVWTWIDDRTVRLLGAAHGARDRGAPVGRAARGRRSRSRSNASSRSTGSTRCSTSCRCGLPPTRRAVPARRSTCTAPTATASGWCASATTASSSPASTRRATSPREARRPTCCCSSYGDASPATAVEVFGDAALLDRWQEQAKF